MGSGTFDGHIDKAEEEVRCVIAFVASKCFTDVASIKRASSLMYHLNEALRDLEDARDEWSQLPWGLCKRFDDVDALPAMLKQEQAN